MKLNKSEKPPNRPKKTRQILRAGAGAGASRFAGEHASGCAAIKPSTSHHWRGGAGRQAGPSRCRTSATATIANGTGCAISLLGRTVPRAKISPHSSPSMRSGFRERTHEAQRRRSNPLDSRATHPRHEHDDARAAAAAAAVATSMGGSSHAADIATGDSAIGPPTPRRCWDLPRQ